MPEIRLKITKHAYDKMLWLGVTEEQVKDAIMKGSKFKQSAGILAAYKYVRVAYKVIGKWVYKVKTVYLE